MVNAQPVAVTNMNPHLAEFLRRAFRVLNRYMVLMWRLDMGWWFTLAPRYTGQIMVLNHTGHKSGLPRRTPLNYARVEGELYCTAGFGQVAHWYRNIMAIPQVEVWLPEGRWCGVAEDITDQPHALEILRQVLIGSGFATFAAGINPYTLDDAALAEATRGYRVVHIRRTEAIAGHGDLSWVWQVAAVGLIFALMQRRHPSKN